MPTDIALIRLLSWLSPAFPVGAFSYSHGLEAAVEQGHIGDCATAGRWIVDLLGYGAGRADTVLLAHAWRAVREGDAGALNAVAERAVALSATKELALETEAQGSAFLKAVATAWPTEAIAFLRGAHDGPVAYPVAVGVVAAGHDVPLTDTATAYLHAFGSNLISAVVRLVPLGQSDGLRLTGQIEPLLPRIVVAALATPLDRITLSTLRADMASMQHETQRTRLFRS